MAFPQKISGDNIGGGKNSTKQSEINLANHVGGERHRYSGAVIDEKGDVSCDKGIVIKIDKPLLFDHKETGKLSYSFKQREIVKLEKEAKGSLRYPSFVIQFNEPLKELRYVKWIMLPLEFVCPNEE